MSETKTVTINTNDPEDIFRWLAGCREATQKTLKSLEGPALAGDNGAGEKPDRATLDQRMFENQASMLTALAFLMQGIVVQKRRAEANRIVRPGVQVGGHPPWKM